jgi:hypothetical protein
MVQDFEQGIRKISAWTAASATNFSPSVGIKWFLSSLNEVNIEQF